MKIIVIYGPPCSGKTTYVLDHIGEKDVVYDYDKIMEAITSKQTHDTQMHIAHSIVWAIRWTMLNSAGDRIEKMFWITTKLDEELKQQLEAGGRQVQYLAQHCTMEECLDRLERDETRRDKGEWKKVIEQWFFEREVNKTMKAELRADGLHISGYVNVPGRMSRPVMTPRGKVVEIIEQRAFAKAIERASEVSMLLDHNKSRKLASTADNTLEVYEDEVGLRADSVVTDEEVIAGAKAGKLKGWSFNMIQPKDSIEERADDVPLRRVSEFDMNEISLIMNINPVYSSTSIELRADGEVEEEIRSSEAKAEFKEVVETPKETFDNSTFKERLEALKNK